MISICIPIYNYNVVELVKSLSSQIKQLEEKIEIILIDDGSDENFKKINETIIKQHIYIQLGKNIGRAAIRNRFLKYAKFDYLLFLDCDCLIPSPDFLSNYVAAINKNIGKVICGGRLYPTEAPDKNRRLRWKYGRIKESKTFEERQKNPNQSFMTNNFLVHKDILTKIPFNEKLVDYGHEDTLFGFELKKKVIEIKHINNPVLNGDTEDNLQFLLNTEKSIINLIYILESLHYDKTFIEDVSLLKTYYKTLKFKRMNLFLFKLFGSSIRSSLSHGNTNLNLFDFYKLGFLSTKMAEKTF